MTTTETIPTWDELMPHGAIRYYEGDDPDGFAAEMLAEFGFDVTEGGEDEWLRWGWGADWAPETYSFLIPPGLVGAVYGSERWPLGS